MHLGLPLVTSCRLLHASITWHQSAIRQPGLDTFDALVDDQSDSLHNGMAHDALASASHARTRMPRVTN